MVPAIMTHSTIILGILLYFLHYFSFITFAKINSKLIKKGKAITMYDKLYSTMKQSIDNGMSSGVNLLVQKDGKEVIYCEYGYRDLDNKIPMARDTIFRIYSASKPVTSAAAMLLVSRGQLDLAADISTYLPEFKNPYVNMNDERVPATRGIKVKDLLNMTSGLPYPDASTPGGRQCAAVFDTINDRLYTDHPVSTQEFVRMMAENDLCFHPGSKFMYGVSADILGGIIERVADMSLPEFMQKELFEPLEMQDTAFYVPQEKAHRVAKVYGRPFGQIQEVKTNNLGIKYTLDVPPAFASGGAGLCSTIDDYSHFANMLLNNGEYAGRQILPSKIVTNMTKGGMTDIQTATFQNDWVDMCGYTYGNLLRVCLNESQTIVLTSKGEYGWNGWLGTYFSNEPAHNLTVLMGIQSFEGDPESLARKLKNIIMSELTK